MPPSSILTHIPATQSSAPIHEFACLYTHDIKRKNQKRWQDGLLRLHTFNNRVMVYDQGSALIGETFLKNGRDSLEDGDELTLDRGVMIQVCEAKGSVKQDREEILRTVGVRGQPGHGSDRGGGTPLRAPGQSSTSGVGFAVDARRSTQIHQQSPAPSIASHLTQLRPKPLNAILRTGRGLHGRANLPDQSPYQERHGEKVADSRTAKRQRMSTLEELQDTPPSRTLGRDQQDDVQALRNAAASRAARVTEARAPAAPMIAARTNHAVSIGSLKGHNNSNSPAVPTTPTYPGRNSWDTPSIDLTCDESAHPTHRAKDPARAATTSTLSTSEPMSSTKKRKDTPQVRPQEMVQEISPTDQTSSMNGTGMPLRGLLSSKVESRAIPSRYREYLKESATKDQPVSKLRVAVTKKRPLMLQSMAQQRPRPRTGSEGLSVMSKLRIPSLDHSNTDRLGHHLEQSDSDHDSAIDDVLVNGKAREENSFSNNVAGDEHLMDIEDEVIPVSPEPIAKRVVATSPREIVTTTKPAETASSFPISSEARTRPVLRASFAVDQNTLKPVDNVPPALGRQREPRRQFTPDSDGFESWDEVVKTKRKLPHTKEKLSRGTNSLGADPVEDDVPNKPHPTTELAKTLDTTTELDARQKLRADTTIVQDKLEPIPPKAGYLEAAPLPAQGTTTGTNEAAAKALRDLKTGQMHTGPVKLTRTTRAHVARPHESLATTIALQKPPPHVQAPTSLAVLPDKRRPGLLEDTKTRPANPPEPPAPPPPPKTSASAKPSLHAVPGLNRRTSPLKKAATDLARRPPQKPQTLQRSNTGELPVKTAVDVPVAPLIAPVADPSDTGAWSKSAFDLFGFEGGEGWSYGEGLAISNGKEADKLAPQLLERQRELVRQAKKKCRGMGGGTRARAYDEYDYVEGTYS
jgi:hypothetical protein